MGRTLGSPNIQPRTKSIVRQVIKAHPELPVKGLVQFLCDNYETLRLRSDEIPGEHSVEKIRAEWRNPRTPEDKQAKEEIERLSQPWHLGLMGEYREHISSEAIPHIVAVQESYDKDNLELLAGAAEVTRERERGGMSGEPSYVPLASVSIRQAIWISRLFAVTKKSELKTVSWLYTHLEEECILSGEKHFNTIEWDKALRNGVLMEQFQEQMRIALTLVRDTEKLGGPDPIFDRE